MRRISSYIPLLAALAAVCLAGQSVALGIASAASSPTIDKAALNKAVQEALAKAQPGGGTTGAGSTGAAAAPGAATAGGSLGSSEALSKLTEGGEEETPVVPTTAETSTNASTGVSTGVLVPVFIVGGLLIAGIAFFIVRDARSVAPAGDGLGGSGSARDRAVRQRKRRAKAKAARRQRKRNR